MRRIFLAFRSFFSLLFHGELSDALLADMGLSRRAAAAPAAPPPPVARVSDGALQILSILQRDSRLVDFVMEDVASYSDEQIGAAVRSLHDQCKESLTRYVSLQPVVDSVEGTFTNTAPLDANLVKFVGNVPAGKPSGGILRHKGWRAARIELPALNPRQDATVIAPAEIEVE